MTDTNLPATTQPHRAQLQAGGAVGALVPQTLEEGFRLAQAMAMSGMTPRDIDTPEKVLVAIMAGAELGMKPFQAVQSFAIVNGRPSLWGDGLMALALTNGLDVEEWMEGDGDARVAFCTVKRPDTGKVVTRDYSVAKAKTAKLWGKVSKNGTPSPWVTSPDRMLQMRARAYAIRDAAADVLRGMPIKEEVEDFIESNPGIMDKQEHGKGTGLLARLESTQTLATEGFGIRDIEKEAGEPAPAAEPKKRGRQKKAVAPTQEEFEAALKRDDERSAAVESGEDGWSETMEREAATQAAESAADDQIKGAAPVEPEQAKTAPDDLFQAEPKELTPFDVFDAAATDAKGWEELRPAMVTLTHSDEWKAKPHDQKKARARVWELVQRWNEDGARLDPAADAFLFQAYVSAMSDAEAITGTLEVAKGMKWYADAPEAYQASVRRFVAGRIEEIGRGA